MLQWIGTSSSCLFLELRLITEDSKRGRGWKMRVILDGQFVAIICDDHRSARIKQRRKADMAWSGRGFEHVYRIEVEGSARRRGCC